MVTRRSLLHPHRSTRLALTCPPLSAHKHGHLHNESLCRSSFSFTCKLTLLVLLALVQFFNCCTAIKLFPVSSQAEPIYNRFINYDGNLPSKELDLRPHWPLDRVTRLDGSRDFIDRVSSSSSQDRSGESPVSEEENSILGSTKEQTRQQQSRPELLPRRERRFWYNRWLQWFKPMDRISVGFMPVHSRGRKTSFIAARGKKSTTGTISTRLSQDEKFSSDDKAKVAYYLVTVKRRPVDNNVN